MNLKDSIDLLSKFKIFHHLMNNSKNKTNNYSSKNKLLITEEFQKYKEDANAGQFFILAGVILGMAGSVFVLLSIMGGK